MISQVDGEGVREDIRGVGVSGIGLVRKKIGVVRKEKKKGWAGKRKISNATCLGIIRNRISKPAETTYSVLYPQQSCHNIC